MNPSSSEGPWRGYDSLEEAIEGLRRARFQVRNTFRITGRGLVVEGDILEGTIQKGMVLMPVLERYDNIHVALAINAVESVLLPGGIEHVGLVVSGDTPDQPPPLTSGMTVDVLEQSPAA